MTTIIIYGLASNKLVTQGYGSSPSEGRGISVKPFVKRKVQLEPRLNRDLLMLIRDYLELKTRNA